MTCLVSGSIVAFAAGSRIVVTAVVVAASAKEVVTAIAIEITARGRVATARCPQICPAVDIKRRQRQGSAKARHGNARAGWGDRPVAVATRSQTPPIACAVDSVRDRRVVRLASDFHLGLRALF